MIQFALGSGTGFVVQKNKAFAILLKVRSVSPCPIIQSGSSVRAPPRPAADEKDVGTRLPGGDVDCIVAARIPLRVRTGRVDLATPSNPRCEATEIS